MLKLKEDTWAKRIFIMAAIGSCFGLAGGAIGTLAVTWANEIRQGDNDYHIPYQGRLELGGQAVNGPTEFIFRLYDGPDEDAALLWESDPRTLEVSDGYFAAVLGDQDDSTAIDLSAMNHDALYVGMEVDSVDLHGRQRILAVPFAQQSFPGKYFVVESKLHALDGARIDGTLEANAITASGTVQASNLKATSRLDTNSLHASSTNTDTLTVPDDLIRFRSYSTGGRSTLIETGFGTDEWNCGVAGISLSGDMENDSDTGNIMRAYTFKENSIWKVRGSFKVETKNDKNYSAQIGVICVRKSISSMPSWSF